jgi:hypothetical protein
MDWLDPAFRALDEPARNVRLYAGAGPQATSWGCYRLSTAVAVEHLGGAAEDFERRLDAVVQALAWEWDPLARVLWITDWFEKNPPANPNVVQSWAKLAKNVPHCDVRTRAIISTGNSLQELPSSFRAPWAELLKRFQRTESQAQRPQGSGIRDSGIQGAGASRRKSGSDEAGPGRHNVASNGGDPQLEQLAREMLEINGAPKDRETFEESVLHYARARGFNRFVIADVRATVDVVLPQRRSA